MKRSLRTTRSRQSGATLVSLLVGTAISMVVTVAMLLVFRSVALSTTGARNDARSEDQRNAAFLTTGISLQDAGFGVNNAALGSQLVVISGATLDSGTLEGTAVGSGTPRTGNALVWEVRTGGTLQCAGLYAPSAGGLQRLVPQNCSGASTWNTLSWSTTTAAEAPMNTASFVVSAQNCRPYGITDTQGSVMVAIRANAPSGTTVTTTQCLANFPAATT